MGHGTIMLSKCFNPGCSGLYRSLQEGIIFRLEPDRAFNTETLDPQYFWLCKWCEHAMTLTLREDGVVILAPAPPPYAHGVRRDMPLAFNRGNGLVLRSVSFWPRPAR